MMIKQENKVLMKREFLPRNKGKTKKKVNFETPADFTNTKLK